MVILDKKLPRVMLIPPLYHPIPFYDGGIESVIRDLIEVNEIERKMILFIPSVFPESTIEHTEFLYSHFFYFKNGVLTNNSIKISKINYYLCWITTIIKKVLFNRYTNRLLGKNRIGYPNYFLHQCLKICKKHNIVGLINESCNIDINSFGQLVDYVGKKNAYYRIHNSTPVGSSEARNIFPNSISLSLYGKERWTCACNLPGDNQVVYNGIDLSLFDKCIDKDFKIRLRNKLGIDNNDNIILYCGRIDRLKGIDVLLDAFDSLNSKNTKLLIISGLATNQQNDSFLKSMISRIEKNKSIIHLGYVPRKELFYYYQLADIQIVPTLCEEAAGLVCIEGMASGLPLIITNSGGMVEYVDNKCAIIIPRNNDVAKTLSKEIEELLSNPSKMKEMGKYAKKRSALFSREENYRHIYDIMKKIKS